MALKGVMLSHDAVTFAARMLGKYTGIGQKTKEKQVQYMPVNHAGASSNLYILNSVCPMSMPHIWILHYFHIPTCFLLAIVLGLECMIATGGECWFAASDAIRGALVQHFKKIGPVGVVVQVPRIWEKFHENLAPPMRNATGIKKHLLNWARKQVMVYIW